MVESIKNLIEEENSRMIKTENWYEFEFEYLGYAAKAVRYSEYSHLCGYIKTDFELSDEMYQALEDNSHGGITFNYKGWIGFDCNHAWDFNLDMYWKLEEMGVGADFETHLTQETYRDLVYVIQTLKNMIAAINDERMKHEKL